MSSIEIRQCRRDDNKSIADICYKTGYMGEDLSGLNAFNDRVLFSYFFSDYYPLYESMHSFVAVDKDKENLVVGYIIGTDNSVRQVYKDYPAHLHINILQEYQHSGIGSALINSFEKHMKAIGVRGIHLTTSNKNYKAISFYESKGYHLAFHGSAKVWKVKDYKSLIYVKKLI
ncbi:MAG: N-acetyltransferase family protein [Caulobacteraceae bacterium]